MQCCLIKGVFLGKKYVSRGELRLAVAVWLNGFKLEYRPLSVVDVQEFIAIFYV